MQNKAQRDICRTAGIFQFSLELIWCTSIVSTEDMCFPEYKFAPNKERLSLSFFQNHSVFTLTVQSSSDNPEYITGGNIIY